MTTTNHYLIVIYFCGRRISINQSSYYY